MLIIQVESGNIEKALKKYKSKVIKTKQIIELRNRQEFDKPSSKKRATQSKAKYLQKKKDLIDKD